MIVIMKTNRLVLVAILSLITTACGLHNNDDNGLNNEGIVVHSTKCSISPADQLGLKIIETTLPIDMLDIETRYPFLMLDYFSMRTNEEVDRWKEQENIKVLAAYMTEQYYEHTDNPIKGWDYLYGALEDLSITADRSIYGRAAGEELRDLYHIHSYAPIFSYPNGDWVDVGDAQYYDIDEWISGNYMLSSGKLTLTLKDQTSSAGITGPVEFTIVTEVSSGERNTATIVRNF